MRSDTIHGFDEDPFSETPREGRIVGRILHGQAYLFWFINLIDPTFNIILQILLIIICINLSISSSSFWLKLICFSMFCLSSFGSMTETCGCPAFEVLVSLSLC